MLMTTTEEHTTCRHSCHHEISRISRNYIVLFSPFPHQYTIIIIIKSASRIYRTLPAQSRAVSLSTLCSNTSHISCQCPSRLNNVHTIRTPYTHCSSIIGGGERWQVSILLFRSYTCTHDGSTCSFTCEWNKFFTVFYAALTTLNRLGQA